MYIEYNRIIEIGSEIGIEKDGWKEEPDTNL